MMDCVFIYNGKFNTGEKGYPMIKGCAAKYLEEIARKDEGESESDDLKHIEISDFLMESILSHSLDESSDFEIRKTSKGKPYFPNQPFEMSLSHSDSFWACMFSHNICGIDIQVRKSTDYEKITRRFFNHSEQDYVREAGEDGFFLLWTYREAFAKCTGGGFFSEMPSFVKNGKPVNSLVFKGKNYEFFSPKQENDLFCTICKEAQ